ncbi:MAG: ribonuclease BN, partial [Chloroflexi bacterium]|nr:ribonuclease BN [Chloroflexota bacterium]
MKTAILLARRSVEEFLEDNCTQMAAAISYYVLF